MLEGNLKKGNSTVCMKSLLQYQVWGKQIFNCFEHVLILQVYISTVSLLTDSQLAELGIDKVGDRAILRKQCRDYIHSKLFAWMYS